MTSGAHPAGRDPGRSVADPPGTSAYARNLYLGGPGRVDPIDRQEHPLSSNPDIVRTITAALGRGDLLAVMGLVSKDVRWAVNAADRDAAPWSCVYQGKRSPPDFFAELSRLTFTDFTLKAVLIDGDLPITWPHVAFTSPKGRDVGIEEVQIWQLADGKARSVDTLLDTAAVGAAFA
jgi:ketosteroid isomerase-like protein